MSSYLDRNGIEARKVAQTYSCSLLNLRTSSRPVIGDLTTLARKNVKYASTIVRVIEDYLGKVHYDVQLPVLYLVDSIMKNARVPYADLFAPNIVENFCRVLEASRDDQKRVDAMKKLRSTWSPGILPAPVLLDLDRRIASMELLVEKIDLTSKISAVRNELMELQRTVEESRQENHRRHGKNLVAINVKKRNSDVSGDSCEGDCGIVKKPKKEKSDSRAHCRSFDDDEDKENICRSSNEGQRNKSCEEKVRSTACCGLLPVDLIENLLKAGLIANSSGASSEAQPADAQRDTSSPEIVESTSKPKSPAAPVRKDKAALQAKRKALLDALFDPVKLKSKDPANVVALYSGKQCSSCGERFQGDARADSYHRHLDQHFQENRKLKVDLKRGATCRSWFMSIDDWVNRDEDAEVEDKGTTSCLFERRRREAVEPSVRDVGNRSCCVCNDPFEQFFHEEEDEWHLKPALCREGVNVHPVCLEDYLAEKSM